MGRPTKLTPEVHETIVGLLRQGNYHETASAVAGIDPITVRRWVQRGARVLDKHGTVDGCPVKEQPFAAFAEDYRAALPTFEASAVNTLLKSKEPRYVLEVLKRRIPERWGDRLDVRVQEQALNHVIEWIRESGDQETYERVLEILRGPPGDEEAGAEQGERLH